MDVGLAVFCCSALAYHGFYQMMKVFLRKMFLKPQPGQKSEFSGGEIAHMANLYVVTSGCRAERRNLSQQMLCTGPLTAPRVTSMVNAIVTCCGSVVVVWQASHDCIFGR